MTETIKINYEDAAVLAALAEVVLDCDDATAFCRSVGTTKSKLEKIIARVSAAKTESLEVKG
jgi:hypothetical protein